MQDSMFLKLRPLLTTLFAAGYLAQVIFLGVAHHHTVDRCAHGSQCSVDLQGRSSEHEHPHGACEEPRCHSPIEQQGGSKPTRKPAHNEENCSVCHFLAASSATAESVSLQQVGEIVDSIEFTPPVFYAVSLTQIHLPRGPPTRSC